MAQMLFFLMFYQTMLSQRKYEEAANECDEIDDVLWLRVIGGEYLCG